MNYFKKLRLYFTEFYFLNLVQAQRNQELSTKNGIIKFGRRSVLAKSLYANILHFANIFLELTRLRQQIFFLSAGADFISHRSVFFDNNQAYMDKKAMLWGVTNRLILSRRQISKGIESELKPGSGLLVNLSLAYMHHPRYNYLLRQENLVSSVGYRLNIDYPLFAAPDKRHEFLLLTFLHILQRRLVNRSTYTESSFISMGLLASLRVRRAMLYQKLNKRYLNDKYATNWRYFKVLAYPSIPKLRSLNKNRYNFAKMSKLVFNLGTQKSFASFSGNSIFSKKN